MNGMKVIKLSEEELEESISGLTQLKPILQQMVLKGNGANMAQGAKDSREIGQHIDTAINSMVTILAYMGKVEDE